MKKKLSFFLIMLFCTAASAQRIPIKNVAVIETQIDERSGAASKINKAEVSVLTNEIRREAVSNLPRGRFNVMTTETVQAMGAAVLEECAEENCVIALGSKIGADYIVRGIISTFAENLTLSIEIYETEYGMLVATAASIRSANLNELLEKTIAASTEMYKKFLESSSPAAPQQAVPPPPPAAYTLTMSVNPSLGGTVMRNPDRTNYASQTPVIVTAVPSDGYRFTGWSGALTSKNPKETVTMDSNMTLTANFARTYVLTTNALPERGGSVSRHPDMIRYDAGSQVTLTAIPAKGYRFTGWSSGALTSNDSILTRTINNNLSLTASFTKQKEKPEINEPPAPLKPSFWLGLSLDVIGAGALAYGLIENDLAKKNFNKYDYSSARKSESNRNTAYTVGTIVLLSGISIHLFF